MPVTHAMGVAQSGMSVATERLRVSANNVANMDTDGYKAKEVVVKEHESGGVTSEVVPTPKEAPVMMRESGMIEGSNTDLIRETVNRVQAINAYRANAQVARTASEVSDSLIDAI